MNTCIQAPQDGDWEAALLRLTRHWRSICIAIRLAPPSHLPVQSVVVNDSSFELIAAGEEPLRINLGGLEATGPHCRASAVRR
jgi:hypothetical protein